VSAARVISRRAGNDARAKRKGSTVKFGTIYQMNREPFGGAREDALALMREDEQACRKRWGQACVHLSTYDDGSECWKITRSRDEHSALWTTIVWRPNATEMRGELELFEGKEAS
jgi:hypothetical protein